MRKATQLLAAVMLVVLTSASAASAAPITGNTGPGGVGILGPGSPLVLWLRGDQGVQVVGTDVVEWQDQSGHGQHVSPTSAANRPHFTDTRNGVPVLTFNPTGVTTQFLQRAGGIMIGGGGDATMFTAYLQNNVQHGLPFFARSPGNFGLHSDDTTSSPFTIRTFPVGSANNTTINGVRPSTLATSTWGVVHGSTGGVNTTTPYNLTIGADACCTGSRNLDGHIGEVAIYNVALNDAQRIIVDNYLSAKYDIPLAPAVKVYGGDAPGIDRDFDVFGIGATSTSSHLNGGSAGFGIEVTDGSLTANEWVLAGHDGSVNSLELFVDGSLMGSRWSRTWYVDVTGEVNATLGFDFTHGDLAGEFDAGSTFQLLYSPTNSYQWEILSVVGTSDGSGLVTFTVPAALLVDGFYTLGINIALVPEPSTLLLVGLAGVGLPVLRRRRQSRA